MLSQAGNYVREEALAGFIRLVAHTPELQSYTTSKLYSALHADISQESLTLAAVWLIGEYGDGLIETGLVEEEVAKQVFLQDHHSACNLLIFHCTISRSQTQILST